MPRSDPFALRRPCAHCPFRTDVVGGGDYIRRDRAVEIAQSLAQGSDFPCHKTVEHDEDGDHIPGAGRDTFCAGALIMLEKAGQPNQLMRSAERMGIYDPSRLDMSAPVVGSPHAFIAHHTPEDEREDERECCHVSDMGCQAPAGYADGTPGEGEAEYECGLCGEPVCGACSVNAPAVETGRACNDCVENGHLEEVSA